MNHYAGKTLNSKGGRHYWFSDYLHRAGYEPVIFCCNVVHNAERELFIQSDDLWNVRMADEIGTPYVYVRARTYQSNGRERVLNMLDFYRNVQKAAKEYAKRFGPPDVILASSVHPLTLVAGIRLAKTFSVPCVCEIRDLWPEALVAYSKKLQKAKALTKLLYQGEKWIYKRADALIFTQEGGVDYIRAHGWDLDHGGPIDLKKVFYINNGVDLEAFDRNLELYSCKDPELEDPDSFKVIYAGAIRRVNDLGLILDTAKEIKNPRIRFLIYGSGDEQAALEERVRKEQIQNVRFMGRVEKNCIPYILSKADVSLAHWQMTPLLRLGESCNKTFEYMAAGKPIYYTVRPKYSIVEKHDCGAITGGFSSKELAEGLDQMAALPRQELERLGNNARRAAAEYDFRVLTDRLIDIIETL